MVVIRWRFNCRDIFNRLRGSVSWKFEQAHLTVRALTYNEHLNQAYVIDFILDPIFWFVDHFAGYLGRVFVFCVSVLLAAVVSISYWVGIPYWWERNRYVTALLVLSGNWILLNVLFHYYKGVVTSPGHPPHKRYKRDIILDLITQQRLRCLKSERKSKRNKKLKRLNPTYGLEGSTITEAASICKKCIAPKPARTHHCSVCDRCVLAMDHHCPWLNNCVGYFNSRHFYLCMVYMVLGVTFLMVAGVEIGYVALWLNDTGGIISHNDPDLIGHSVRLNRSGVLVPVNNIAEYDSEVFPREHDLPVPTVTEAQRITAHPWKRKAVIFMALLCLAVFFALGFLLYSHGRNVSRGETSVEAHINASLRKTQGDLFRNPYDFGWRKNWMLFLGLVQGRTFLRHALWPSGHRPVGNGLNFHTVFEVAEDWP